MAEGVPVGEGAPGWGDPISLLLVDEGLPVSLQQTHNQNELRGLAKFKKN